MLELVLFLIGLVIRNLQYSCLQRNQHLLLEVSLQFVMTDAFSFEVELIHQLLVDIPNIHFEYFFQVVVELLIIHLVSFHQLDYKSVPNVAVVRIFL
jgi:hypothetical protein